MFESLVPYIKDRLTKHHELYSGQCKAEYWEENCAYALRQAGFGSDWSPDFNHGVGVDQTTGDGIRISNKGGKVLEDLSEMTISGSRLTKHKTISDKLEFLKTKHEDYILCLATNNDDLSIGVNSMILNIVFNIKQDPNTLDSVQVTITNTGEQTDNNTSY